MPYELESIPDDYEEIFETIYEFVKNAIGNYNWKMREKIKIRKKIENLSKNVNSVCKKYIQGDIEHERLKSLLVLADLGIRNLLIESDLLDDQHRRKVVNAAVEAVIAIVRSLTGVDVSDVLEVVDIF